MSERNNIRNSMLINGFVKKRQLAIEKLPEFDTLRDEARDIKNHVLTHLDYYLEYFEEKVHAQGDKVHLASDATEANEHILKICQAVNAVSVTKGKSMISILETCSLLRKIMLTGKMVSRFASLRHPSLNLNSINTLRITLLTTLLFSHVSAADTASVTVPAPTPNSQVALSYTRSLGFQEASIASK